MSTAVRQFTVTVDETAERQASVRTRDAATVEVQLNGTTYTVRLGPRQGALRSGWINGKRVAFAWNREAAGDGDGNGYRLYLDGTAYSVHVLDAMTKQLRDLKKASATAGEVRVKAPMPGVVLAVNVQPGQAVRSGEVLCILEAMKMQNEIRASHDGVVQSVAVAAGQSVARNDALLVLGPTSAAAAAAAGVDGSNDAEISPV